MSNALITRPSGVLTRSDPQFARRLALFAKTTGKHLIGAEIDEALERAEALGANVFTGDIIFMVMHANDKEKRQVVPVLTIQLYRKNAGRAGDYRPDDQPPRFRYDETLVGPDNPRGIVDCEVAAYKYMHGEWHRIVARVRWEERAPIIEGGSEGFEYVDTGEVWADSGKPKKKKVPKGELVRILDPGKPNWSKMPESMLEKCTIAAVIRMGWPYEVQGAYAEGEMDGGTLIELSASEIIDLTGQDERKAKLGLKNPILIDWLNDQPLEAVEADKLHGRAQDWLNQHLKKGEEEYGALAAWWAKNRASFQQFWTLKKDEALAIKERVEQAAKDAKAAEAEDKLEDKRKK